MNESSLRSAFDDKSDEEVLRELRFLAERARHNELRLVWCMAVFEDRRLGRKMGIRNLYDYAIGTLGFEAGEAYRRVRAARVLAQHALALPLLEKGRVTISTLAVLSYVINPENAPALFLKAEGKTKKEVEAIVAAEFPQAALPDSMRRLPGRLMIIAAEAPPPSIEAAFERTRPAAAPAAATDATAMEALPPSAAPPELGEPSSAGALPAWASSVPAEPRLERGWQAIAAVSIDRVRVGFDAAASLAGMIERAKEILRHKYPEGRLEDVIREALEILLERKDPQRRLALKKPAEGPPVPVEPIEGPERIPHRMLRSWATARYIPARVKSLVWQRDGGRCSWRDKDGIVCGSKEWLEYDHIRAFAIGGRSDDPRNIRLLCREHNSAAAYASFNGRLSEASIKPADGEASA